MKEKITISIDADTLKLAKEHIPNISNFVEGCFNAWFKYLTYDEENKGEELRKNWEDFHRAKLNIHLLMNVDDKQKDIERVHQNTLDLAWRGIWKDYRFTQTYQPHAMEEAVKILHVSKEELEEVMEDCLFAASKDRTKLYIFDTWKYVEENFLPYIDLNDDDLEEFHDLLN
jgi:hypothetical protein